MELSQAIVNMEQGGSADGLLQVHGLYVYVMPTLLIIFCACLIDALMGIFRSGLTGYNQI